MPQYQKINASFNGLLWALEGELLSRQDAVKIASEWLEQIVEAEVPKYEDRTEKPNSGEAAYYTLCYLRQQIELLSSPESIYSIIDTAYVRSERLSLLDKFISYMPENDSMYSSDPQVMLRNIMNFVDEYFSGLERAASDR